MRAPFDDLKQGMIDIVENLGKCYARKHFKSEIIHHATGRALYDGDPEKMAGLPMTLGRLVDAVEKEGSMESYMFFLRPNANVRIDLLLYAIHFDVIKAIMEETLAEITPQDLGYSRIRKDEIGPTREGMRALIAQKQAEIESLKERRSVVITMLSQLGITVAWVNGRAIEASALRADVILRA